MDIPTPVKFLNAASLNVTVNHFDKKFDLESKFLYLMTFNDI